MRMVRMVTTAKDAEPLEETVIDPYCRSRGSTSPPTLPRGREIRTTLQEALLTGFISLETPRVGGINDVTASSPSTSTCDGSKLQRGIPVPPWRTSKNIARKRIAPR